MLSANLEYNTESWQNVFQVEFESVQPYKFVFCHPRTRIKQKKIKKMSKNLWAHLYVLKSIKCLLTSYTHFHRAKWFHHKTVQHNIYNQTQIGLSSECKKLHEVFYLLKVIAHSERYSLKV